MQEKLSVIVIDPNISFVEDLQRYFMLIPDFDLVATATLGMDGYGKVQSLQPNFVVIAHPLPDVDITQLVSNLAQHFPNIKRICSLETENPILNAKLIGVGAQYVLTKPYSADKLLEVMKSLNNKPSTPVPADMMGGGAPVDALKGAMDQFSQQQEQGFGGANDVPSSAVPQATWPNMQNPIGGGQMNPNQQNPYGQNVPYGVPPQQYPNQGGYPPPGGFPLQPGHFPGQPPQYPPQPYPQQPPFGGGFEGGFPGMGGPAQFPNTKDPNAGMQQRGGGVRTIKQTTIAVNCPKGGVGKTTISKELAQAFSTVKVNGQPLKVCLVDCDLDFGDVASMLKLNPYPNITHWTSDIAQRLKENPNADCRYSQAQIEQKFLITLPTGLKVLAAPSNHTDALEITRTQMEIVIDNLKACDFDIIILDTGNNTKDYTLVSLDKASTILMVTTMEITAIQDTNMLLNTLRNIQFPTTKIKLVVNKMPREKDIDTAEISQLLHCPIIGIVPEYPKIRILNNSGTPAVLAKETEFSAAIRKIGHAVVPVFNRPSGAPSGGKAPKEGGGLFGKLFGKK